MRRGLALLSSQRLLLAWRLLGLGLLAWVVMIWGRNAGWMATAQMPAPQAPTVVVAEVTRKTVPLYSEFVARTEALQTLSCARVSRVFSNRYCSRKGQWSKRGKSCS